MAEDDPRERVWSYVASHVAERFGLFTGRSPTLAATINHGARYVKLEKDGVLFDSRALTLGLLAAGTTDPTGVTFSNAAVWFRAWVQDRMIPVAVDEALVRFATVVEAVEQALDQKVPVGLSISVQDLLKRADRISDATVGHTAFEGRHLFAAMIEKGTIAEQLQQLFGLDVTAGDITELKSFLVKNILLTPAAGETRDRWDKVLALPSSPPSPPPPPSPSGDEIIRFIHDDARGGGNVLATERDVEALAKLVCLKGSTPLAVALFGGWGSGKTTFMTSLDDKIEAIAGDAAECLREGVDTPFVSRIVQIKFNAWQFVDANLWASLTAEFFDQLRAGGWRRAGTVRHAGLVEKVNSHVHSLTAEAAAHRAAVVESNRHVLEAQEERDAAARAVRDAPAKAMGQAAMETLGEIYEGQKGNLRAMGIARGTDDPAKGVDAVIEAVRSSRSILQRGRTIFRMVWKYQAAAALVGAILLLVAAGGFWLFRSDAQVGVGTAIAALGSFAAFWRAAAPAVRFVNSVAQRGADLARALDSADEDAVKALMGKEVTLRDATREAEAQARVADRADRNLARYVDPAGPSNPPRLLRYVLEDDPETKAFEEQIGLIGRARRLFQAVNDIIVKDDGEAPQRIVLYIDDLDRCTEKQVYDVLQAIHLLLAFESFAVVVGVDVKWIESALAAEFAADKEQRLTEFERRQHAVHYLEKIFQVAFWLDPLTGGADGSFGAFVKALTKPEPPAPAPPPPAPPPPVSQEGPGAAAPVEAVPSGPPAPSRDTRGLLRRVIDFVLGRPSAGGHGEDPSAGPALSGGGEDTAPKPPDAPVAKHSAPSRTREAFRTIEIDSVESEFLASPEIAALAGSTPRSAKRLVNVYRLVRSRRADGGASLLGGDGRPPDYPLIALTTAIETGQSVEVACAFLNALDSVPVDMEITTLRGPPASVKPGLSIGFEQMLAHQFPDRSSTTSDESDSEIIQRRCPGLPAALAKVHELRNSRVVARDLVKVARLARRFSFNRYH